MKKIILTILSITMLAGASPLRAANVGVPSECEDVMLQAFYWDSYGVNNQPTPTYGRTRWIDLLKDTAAINTNFDLVWFPPSAFGDKGNGKGGVGYIPKQYSNQESDWGTKNALSNLINALHKRGTKVIADVVINHRGNYNSWCNFYQDNFGTYGTWSLTSSHICKNDEVNTDTSAGSCKGQATGAYDTGNNFEGARDLDHTSEYVQNWSKAYTQWLLNVMKYDGFRYDMTLGFHGRYLQMYNEAANPYISVSELWHSIDRQKQHLEECDYNTMVFDFVGKSSLKGITNDSYGKLNANKTFEGLRKEGLSRYAVTFIDNHDTFDRGGAYGDNQYTKTTDLTTATNKNHVLQASAYILMMPGIPCVFYPHWASYKEEISEMIAVRKRIGIHSESQVIEEESGPYRYSATIQGHRGQVIVRLGKSRAQLTTVPEGFEVAVEGGTRGEYTIYVKEDGQGVESVKANDTACRKIIYNGNVYILREGKTYNLTGTEVKVVE